MKNEKRLIDVDAARRRIIAFATGLHSEVLSVDTVMMLLTQAPTVDAVEVVRCKDCDHGININNMIACTEFRETIHKPEDFCSYGERKEGAD